MRVSGVIVSVHLLLVSVAFLRVLLIAGLDLGVLLALVRVGVAVLRVLLVAGIGLVRIVDLFVADVAFDVGVKLLVPVIFVRHPTLVMLATVVVTVSLGLVGKRLVAVRAQWFAGATDAGLKNRLGLCGRAGAGSLKQRGARWVRHCQLLSSKDAGRTGQAVARLLNGIKLWVVGGGEADEGSALGEYHRAGGQTRGLADHGTVANTVLKTEREITKAATRRSGRLDVRRGRGGVGRGVGRGVSRRRCGCVSGRSRGVTGPTNVTVATLLVPAVVAVPCIGLLVISIVIAVVVPGRLVVSIAVAVVVPGRLVVPAVGAGPSEGRAGPDSGNRTHVAERVGTRYDGKQHGDGAETLERFPLCE
mmetsp:Transcript_39985/g.71767  ORF Transcript_39985/g.71767 Transcript_39985/m.71767 type:complete len:362 (+) Transcript_39985:524-1609(+)